MLKPIVTLEPTTLSNVLKETTGIYCQNLLESWYRKYDLIAEISLSGSGIKPYSFGEIREILEIAQEELDRVILQDSYSYGNLDLRKAIAQHFGNGNPDNVMVTHGSSEAIYLVMNTILKPGDEVIVLMPSYQPLYAIAQALKCQVKPWFLRPERGFVPDIDEFISLLTPRVKAVIVNFPNNPTGMSLTAAELKILTDAVADVNAFLVWDGAFSELVYDQPPLPNPGQWYSRTISFGTLSKGYGLSGLRVGWCLASPEVLKSCINLRDYITLNLSPLVEYIAQRAIEGKDALLQPRLQQARANLDILESWIHRHQNLIHWLRPQGGGCAFLHLYGIEVDDFCHRLAQDYGVFLLPGTCFGCSEYVRLGFGGSTAVFQEGLSRLSKILTGSLRAVQISQTPPDHR